MNRIGRMIAAIALGLASTGLSAAMVENITTTTYYPWNGQVKVAYDVKGVEAGSTYQLAAEIRAGGKTYAVDPWLVTADGGYDFVWDAAKTNFVGRDEGAEVTISIAEPSYVVVDLDTVVGGKYAISYAVTQPNVDDYKLGKMLFKRVGTQYVGVFEVTQYQYEKVMGTNPAYFSLYGDDPTLDQKRPVERVSYEALTETSGFFDLLKARTGLPFTLPSGENWEEVTKADDVAAANCAYNVDTGAGAYWAITGKDQDKTWMPYLGRYIDLWDGTTKTVNGNNRWNEYSDGTHGTAVVGSYKPTDTGLYDIHGNVSEWTTDEDGEGHHILRGGNFLSSAADCALTAKWTYKDADASQLYKAGFRVFAKADDVAFVHKMSVTSEAFAVDVVSNDQNLRQARVDDNGKFYYTPENGTETNWVNLTVIPSWRPYQSGINSVTNPNTQEEAQFSVEALPIQGIVVVGYDDVYDGEGHTGSVTTKTKSAVIKYGTKEGSYTLLEPPVYTNVCDVKVYYEITSDFYTTVTGSFTVKITPLSIANAEVALGATLTYNGKDQTKTIASVTVKNAAETKVFDLVQGTDYKVSGNVGNAAKGYKMTLEGKGNFCDTKDVDWEIDPFDIGQSIGGGGTAEGVAITFEDDYEANGFTYNGQEQTITVKFVSVKVGGSTQTFDATSFTTLSGNKGKHATAKVGQPYVVTISGNGNFTGTATREWEIKQYDITPNGAATIVFTGDTLTYNGTTQTRQVGKMTTSAGEVPLAECKISGNTGVDASAKAGKYTAKVEVTDETSDFKGSTTKDWSIAQKSITGVAFTLDPEYDYIYSREAKTPTVTADDGTREDGAPMIAKDAGSEWTVAYSDNVNAGDNTAKATITAATSGNYTGTTIRNFSIAKARIDEKMTLKNDTFTWDGSAKTPEPKTVTARGGNLTLETSEYKLTSGSVTDTGHYKAEVESASPNFEGNANAPWKIVPACPEVLWFGMDGKESVTGEGGVKYFYVADLTVAGDAKCTGETLVWSNEVLNAEGKWMSFKDAGITIANDKFHVKARTRVWVRAEKADAEKGDLIGNPTTVELVPGKCADLVLTPTEFDHNNTTLTIAAKKQGSDYVVDGQPLTAAPNYQPYGVAGKTYYKVLDGEDKVVVDRTEYNREASNLKVSADKVKIVTWTEDQQYVWSNVLTQEVTRTIGDVAKPVIKIERVKGDVSKRLVTITCDTDGAVIYWTSATSNGVTHVSDGYPAINPKGKCEVDYKTTDGTRYTTGETLEFKLNKDDALSVKAVAYELWPGLNDFKGRSAVAHEQDLREWCIGDAMDCPDQEFFNGTNQLQVLSGQDTPFFVTNDVTAVGGECMRSGKLEHGNLNTSSLSTFVEGPGMIVFNWKANCEKDPEGGAAWDHGEFVIDGVTTNKIDGITGWQTVTNMLANTGRHMLTWTYVKDFTKQGKDAIPEGEDCILVDCFVWIPAKDFTEIDIDVDHLVYNMKDQVPTKTDTTNYIHAVTSDPRSGFKYELKEGVDYTVEVDAKRDANTYAKAVTLKATKESLLVKGETTVDWTIDPLDISKAEVEYTKSFVYDGRDKTPTPTKVSVSHYLDGTIDVVGETDSYTQTGVPQSEAKGYKFTLVGSKNLTGTTKEFDWEITRRDFETVTLTLDPTEYTYDRNVHTPSYKVRDTDRGVDLTENVDYTIAWPADMTNASEKLTATITGMGNYQGVTKSADYKIKKATVDTLTLDGETQPIYTGGTCTVDGRALAGTLELYSTEWQITDNTGINAGDYKASLKLTAEGEKNFVLANPAPTADWKILPLNITGAELTLEPATYSFEYDGTKKSVQSTDITTVKADGIKVNGFTVACTEQSEQGSYTFKITPTDSNFKGEKDYPWSITTRSLAKATITLTTNLVWNGVAEWKFVEKDFVRTIKQDPTEQEMTFDVTDVLPNGTKTNLVLGTDYEIVNESNKGTDAGAYTLTLNGLGNYAGNTVTNWVIVPTLPFVKPNNENPTTNEVYIISPSETTRVSMGRDVDSWGIRYVFKTVDGTVRKQGSVTSERAKYIGTATSVYTMDGTERTLAEAYTYVKASPSVMSDTVFIDYRVSTNASPVIVLADKNNVPYLYEDGTPWTNSVGEVITNFCSNGQLVALTRGNVIVSNDIGGVIGARQAFTNDAENAIYTDGTLRYTLDGSDPTETSAIWVEGTRIAITNTTTIIAKVFGGHGGDSPCVTNIFVRDGYLPPEISYKEEGAGTAWKAAANGDIITFNIVGQQVKMADTNDVGGSILYTLSTEPSVTNKYTEVLSVSNSVIVTAWIGDLDNPVTFSDAITVEFTCDSKLSEPVIAFSNATDVVVAKNETTFTNAWQWIKIGRKGDVYTRDTNGTIYYRLNENDDWTAYVNPFKIWGTTNVYAYAGNSTVGFEDSNVTNITFTQEMATMKAPTITVKPTKTVKQVEFTITRNEGNIVYFTTDETDPVGINVGAKNGISFTEASTNVVLDITEGATNTIKAIAYNEVLDGTDFIGVSAVSSCSTNRASRIGDALRPGVEEKPGSEPSTADLDARSDKNDGYNSEWKDDSKQKTYDTSWVVDNDVAYEEGGKSMRSGDVREVATPESKDGTNSVMTATVYGPGTFRFAWKASTEFEPDDYEGYVFDFCELSVDGVPTGDFTYGTNDWEFVEFTIEEDGCEPKSHTIMWNYIKDDDQYSEEELGCEIEDCVWVDEFTWTAAPNLDQATVTYDPLTYNQQEQFPTFKLTIGNWILTPGADYAVETNMQTYVGSDYTAVIKGLGKSCTGSITVQWAIGQLSITNAIVTLSDGQMYTRKSGKVVEQYATVKSIKVGELELLSDATWTVEGTNATARGTYTATITGSENLTGSVSTNWVIAPRPLTDAKINLTGTLTYAGGVERTKKFSVTYGGTTLGAGDYTLVEGTDKGTTVKGNTIVINAVEGGNYTGSTSQAWTMNPLDITKGTVNIDPTSLVYNGKEQYVAFTNITVDLPSWSGNPISLTNELWSYTGTNGTNVGTYWLVVTPDAEGNLTGGPISNNWTIVQADITGKTTINLKPYKTYNGKTQTQEIESVIVEGFGELTTDDYDVSNNRTASAGIYTLKVTGKGNFKGEATAEWQQLPALIDSVVLDPDTYEFDNVEKTPVLTVMAGAMAPTLDTDYFVLEGSVTSATTAGVYTVSVKGSFDPTKTKGKTGNYKVPTDDLTTNVTWTITERPIENVTITIDDLVYNREVQEPTITVEDSGAKITTDDYDYTIEPSEVKTAGVYTVTFTAKGNYKNTTNVTFKVEKAQVNGFKLLGAKTPTYNGQVQTVKGLVTTTNALTLTSAEYHLENGTGTNAGKYTAAVVLDDENFEFKGGAELTADWWILPKDISDSIIKVTLAHPIIYTATEQTIEDGDITAIAAEGLPVLKWNITCDPKTNVGKDYVATMTPTGDNNFTGIASVQWEIEPRDITNGKVTFEEEPILWTGDDLTVKMATIEVDGYTFQATDTTFDYAGDVEEEAGSHTITVTGTDNFEGEATATWKIRPTKPTIKPSKAGAWSKVGEYITVEMTRDVEDWDLIYTTNGTDWVTYPIEGGKFDIEKRMTIQAKTISKDGTITSDVAKVEYYFGENVNPTIGLWGGEGVVKPEDSEAKGAEQFLVEAGTENLYTNFFYGATKVNISRYGLMTADEIVYATNTTTVVVGDITRCPYTDGNIWYTVNYGEEIVAPTNNTENGSVLFVATDKDTWPTISSNATIVAKVFGTEMVDSDEITNTFVRIWEPAPDPTVTPDTSFKHKMNVEITKRAYSGNDPILKDEKNIHLFYTLDGTTPTTNSTEYTGVFEITGANTNSEGIVVLQTIAATLDGDHLTSNVVTGQYTYVKVYLEKPVVCAGATFHHASTGYEVTITRPTAPLGEEDPGKYTAGTLVYSTDQTTWTPYTAPFTVHESCTVYAKVIPNAGDDYFESDFHNNAFELKPYTYGQPTITGTTPFETASTVVTITRPAAPQGDDSSHTGVLWIKVGEGAWTKVDAASKEVTINATTTIEAQVRNPEGESDHVEQAAVSKTFTRVLKVVPQVYLTDKDGKPLYEDDGTTPATNFWHVANLNVTGVSIEDAKVYYVIDRATTPTECTAGLVLPVTNSFEVIAWAEVNSGLKGPAVTNVYTRKWETLVQPKITLIDPYGDSRTEFWNTGDRIAITNNETAVAERTAVLWPENATVKYAVYTNSNDTTTVPTDWATFVQGVTTNFFKADTNAVWAIVEADDYLPSTNAVSFIRQFAQIGELTENMIHFDSPETRYEVDVTFDMPTGANAIYYTYEITNDVDGVATPWGNEYDVTKSSARYEDAFKVAIRPHQTLIVKARPYYEDDSSENVGVAETNFTARGEVVVGKYTLPWKIEDSLDVPDWKTFTVADSMHEGSTATYSEDTEVVSFGTSSIKYSGLVDSQSLTLETIVYGPGVVSFDWKTFCEKGPHSYNYDHMTFYVNGTVIARLDGDSGWQSITNRINGSIGTKNVLRWVYEKDDSEHGFKEEDAAWLDHFCWTSETTQLDVTDELRDWTEYIVGTDDFEEYFITAEGDDNLDMYQEFLAKTAENGRSYWECYVLGLDVEDWESDLFVNAPIINEYSGAVTITWGPVKAGRTYTLVGKKDLGDANWQTLTVQNATEDADTGSITRVAAVTDGYKFFTLRIKMTQD